MIRRLAVCALVVTGSGCAHQVYAPAAGDAMPAPAGFGAPAPDAGPAPQVCTALAAGDARGMLDRIELNNLDLKQAAARLRQANAVAVQARAPGLPRLDGRVDYSRGDAGTAGLALPGFGPVITERHQASLAASYELDAWGRVGAGAAAAELDALASAELLQSLRITVHAQALETWFSLLAEQRLTDLLEQQRQTSSRFLELTRLRFGLGQTAAQDVGRQNQNVLSLDGQLAQSRERAALLAGRLAALAGTVAADGLTPPRRFPDLPPLADPGLPSELAQQRPDVRAAMASLKSADQRTAEAAAARLPRFTLTGSLVSVEEAFADLLSGTLWQTGAAAAAPVFDAGASRARIEAAEAGAETALYAWASTLLAAWREVDDALVSNRRQSEFIQSLDAQLDEAAKVLTLTRDAYRQGQGDYLDVLTALLSQQALERQRLEAERRQFVNRITLCRALGVGPDTTVGTTAANVPADTGGKT